MKTKSLAFQGYNNDKCYIINRGKVYDFYRNGFFEKSIKAIRPYFIVCAIVNGVFKFDYIFHNF